MRLVLEKEPAVTTAFVLSGGGSLGAVQVGMLRALYERGWQPDLLIGSSAGALNAAFIGARGLTPAALDDLERVWCSLRRQDVFPFRPGRQLLALAGARPSLCSPEGMARLIDAHLGLRNLEDAAVPTHVVATDVLSGLEVRLSSGSAALALLASAAIPAVFPPVKVDGRVLFDGGVADNTPVSQAVELGVDRVVVIPAGVACGRSEPPRSALATAVHALTLLIEQRLVLDVAAYHDQVDLVVIPPLCPLAVSASDFRHAPELIERARSTTHAWLDGGGEHRAHPERFLTLHDHSGPDADSTGGTAA
jgi:NTE family protein